jgi:hypothetical protein
MRIRAMAAMAAVVFCAVLLAAAALVDELSGKTKPQKP